jgi:hypothetical protein
MAYNIKNLGLSKENPVRCSGERGIRLYLDGLFDSAGFPVQYKRIEGTKELACYELTSSDGKVQLVYFDKLNAGYHERVLVEGYKSYKDFLTYKDFTNVKYYNALMKAKGITEDQQAYFKLWKLCGTFLCFGPGFYASADAENMPFPFFNMDELYKACELVVHTLAGITHDSALPFSSKKMLREFQETFHFTIEELVVPLGANLSNPILAKCRYKYEDTSLNLWVEIGDMNNEKK